MQNNILPITTQFTIIELLIISSLVMLVLVILTPIIINLERNKNEELEKKLDEAGNRYAHLLNEYKRLQNG